MLFGLLEDKVKREEIETLVKNSNRVHAFINHDPVIYIGKFYRSQNPKLDCFDFIYCLPGVHVNLHFVYPCYVPISDLTNGSALTVTRKNGVYRLRSDSPPHKDFAWI